MVKVNYDLRPVDTEVIVYTRNRIRLASVLIIFGILIYLNTSPSFKNPHASWIHLMHVVAQPFIIFVSIADSSMFARGAFLLSLSLIGQDLGVAVLNAISISRCFGELTASCAEQIIEKGILLFVALWISVFGVIILAGTYTLTNQLTEKDATEKSSVESQKSGGDPPTWNSIEVYCNKIKCINIFLLLFDIVYISIAAQYFQENPMFVLSTIHLFIDPFVLFTVNKSKNNLITYATVRIIYFVSFFVNLILLFLFLQTDIVDIGKMISLIITMLYVTTDIIQVFFTTAVIKTMENFKKFKNNQ